jgi:hypothetical protein
VSERATARERHRVEDAAAHPREMVDGDWLEAEDSAETPPDRV